MCLEKQFPLITTYPFCNGVPTCASPREKFGELRYVKSDMRELFCRAFSCLQAGRPDRSLCFVCANFVQAPFFLFGSRLPFSFVWLIWTPVWAVVAMQEGMEGRKRPKITHVSPTTPREPLFWSDFRVLLCLQRVSLLSTLRISKHNRTNCLRIFQSHL
jgi:hypothetical protein